MALWLPGADGGSSFPPSDCNTPSPKPAGLCSLLPGFCVQNGPRYSVLAVGFRDRLQAAKSCGIQRYCLAHKHTVPVGLAAADCPKRPPWWERSLRAILPFWITLGRPPVHFHISLFKECPAQCLPRWLCIATITAFNPAMDAEEAGRFTRLRENDSVLEVASFASCA